MQRLALILFFPLAAAAQTPAQTPPTLDPADIANLLSRINAAVRDNIRKLPDYTCTMTIDRYQGPVQHTNLQQLDRIRLEVAMMGDRELYAWPGSRHFEERAIQDLVPRGSIGTGEFGLFMQSIFLSGDAKFRYVALETLNGRKVYHFTYTVPRKLSRYQVRLPTTEGTVGYAGSTWSDARTLDLVRLEIDVDDIPKSLSVVSAGQIRIDYARAHVGAGDFLLPASVDNSFTVAGWVNRNHISFANCREYTTESTISFAGTPATAAEARARLAPLLIPPDIRIESRLQTELDSASLAIGDQFDAIVTRPVRHNGVVVVPRGARILGRVARLERPGKPYGCIGVVLQPETIEFQGREGPFRADQVLPPQPEYRTRDILQGPTSVPDRFCPIPPEPGRAMVLVNTQHFQVAQGYSIMWRTAEKPCEP
jgi:hypothetical protein